MSSASQASSLFPEARSSFLLRAFAPAGPSAWSILTLELITGLSLSTNTGLKCHLKETFTVQVKQPVSHFYISYHDFLAFVGYFHCVFLDSLSSLD